MDLIKSPVAIPGELFGLVIGLVWWPLASKNAAHVLVLKFTFLFVNLRESLGVSLSNTSPYCAPKS